MSVKDLTNWFTEQRPRRRRPSGVRWSTTATVNANGSGTVAPPREQIENARARSRGTIYCSYICICTHIHISVNKATKRTLRDTLQRVLPAEGEHRWIRAEFLQLGDVRPTHIHASLAIQQPIRKTSIFQRAFILFCFREERKKKTKLYVYVIPMHLWYMVLKD